jgi:hypothetical protein
MNRKSQRLSGCEGKHLVKWYNMPYGYSSLSLELRWQIWQLVALEEPKMYQLYVLEEALRSMAYHIVVDYDEQLSVDHGTAYSKYIFSERYESLPVELLDRRELRTIPLVLRVSQESRREGLRIYERIVFKGRFRGYFNFKRDTLFFPPELWPCLEGWSQTNHFPFGCFRQLQHLTIFMPGKHPSEYYRSGRYTGKLVKRLTERMICAFGREVLPELRTLTYLYDDGDYIEGDVVRSRQDLLLARPDPENEPAPPSDSFKYGMRYFWATKEPSHGFRGGREVQFEFKPLPSIMRHHMDSKYIFPHSDHYFCRCRYMWHMCAVCNPKKRASVLAMRPWTLHFV